MSARRNSPVETKKKKAVHANIARTARPPSAKKTRAIPVEGKRVLIIGRQKDLSALEVAGAFAAEQGGKLQRVDVATIVSRYAGETERNLDRIFRRAEKMKAVLFFDEADALFGKRTGVKDAHDRYANLEVDYLLQRLESFRGIAVVASNGSSLVDSSVLKRFKEIVCLEEPVAETPAAARKKRRLKV